MEGQDKTGTRFILSLSQTQISSLTSGKVGMYKIQNSENLWFSLFITIASHSHFLSLLIIIMSIRVKAKDLFMALASIPSAIILTLTFIPFHFVGPFLPFPSALWFLLVLLFHYLACSGLSRLGDWTGTGASKDRKKATTCLVVVQ